MPIDLELSERQRKVVGAALTLLAVFVILVAAGGVVWLVAAFFRRFAHVFLPLAVAAVAALVFKPFYDWLHERLRLPMPLAVAAVFLAGLIPLAAFLWLFGDFLVAQISDAVEKAPQWWRDLREEVGRRWPEVREFFQQAPMGRKIVASLQDHQEDLLGGLQSLGARVFSAGAGVVGGLGVLASWAVLPVYFAFFLAVDPRRFGDLDHVLPFLKKETRDDLLYLSREFLATIVTFFRGQLVIALLQGILYAVGFQLVGLKYGFVLGLALGFLNIIPYLGSMVGLGIAVPLSLFQSGGGWMLLLWVLVVFTAVQTIEGYLLTPKIMGDRTGLHPVTIIVAIFFWGSALDGILGMILAIPLTAFLVVFWRLAREKYFEEWL